MSATHHHHHPFVALGSRFAKCCVEHCWRLTIRSQRIWSGARSTSLASRRKLLYTKEDGQSHTNQTVESELEFHFYSFHTSTIHLAMWNMCMNSSSLIRKLKWGFLSDPLSLMESCCSVPVVLMSKFMKGLKDPALSVMTGYTTWFMTCKTDVSQEYGPVESGTCSAWCNAKGAKLKKNKSNLMQQLAQN